jgi:hypothetical protein
VRCRRRTAAGRIFRGLFDWLYFILLILNYKNAILLKVMCVSKGHGERWLYAELANERKFGNR